LTEENLYKLTMVDSKDIFKQFYNSPMNINTAPDPTSFEMEPYKNILFENADWHSSAPACSNILSKNKARLGAEVGEIRIIQARKEHN
jgi:hypothetical protein